MPRSPKLFRLRHSPSATTSDPNGSALAETVTDRLDRLLGSTESTNEPRTSEPQTSEPYTGPERRAAIRTSGDGASRLHRS